MKYEGGGVGGVGSLPLPSLPWTALPVRVLFSSGLYSVTQAQDTQYLSLSESEHPFFRAGLHTDLASFGFLAGICYHGRKLMLVVPRNLR